MAKRYGIKTAQSRLYTVHVAAKALSSITEMIINNYKKNPTEKARRVKQNSLEVGMAEQVEFVLSSTSPKGNLTEGLSVIVLQCANVYHILERWRISISQWCFFRG